MRAFRRRLRALHVIAGSLFLACASASGVLARAQEIHLGDLSGTEAKRQHVELLSGRAEVQANRPEWVLLRFRVDPGFHINSHTPKDELLLPTALTVSAGEPVRVVTQEYPAGIPLRLDIGSGETLSTYQGEFIVRVRVVAPAGDSALNGVLRYQACDNHACFPPRSLPVRVPVLAR